MGRIRAGLGSAADADAERCRGAGCAAAGLVDAGEGVLGDSQLSYRGGHRPLGDEITTVATAMDAIFGETGSP